MQLIECQNISKTYLPNTEALKGVTFDIGPAEFIVLAGPNGAGKTTLLKMLYGELQPTVGKLKVNVPLEKVGVMPQEFSLFEELNVWEHTYYLALLKGIEKAKSRELAESVLTRLGMWNKKNTIVRNLSGGQKRLLCACQALTGKNDLLILDEPTIEVDVENRRAMYALLEESRNEGVSILYTTHFLDEIEPWVDRLILINRGQLLYEAPPSIIPIMYSIDLTGLVVRNTILLICLSNDTFIVMSDIPPPITENKMEPMMILGQSAFDEIKRRGVIMDSGMNIVINIYVKGRLKNHFAYIFAIVIMFVNLIKHPSLGN